MALFPSAFATRMFEAAAVALAKPLRTALLFAGLVGAGLPGKLAAPGANDTAAPDQQTVDRTPSIHARFGFSVNTVRYPSKAKYQTMFAANSDRATALAYLVAQNEELDPTASADQSAFHDAYRHEADKADYFQTAGEKQAVTAIKQKTHPSSDELQELDAIDAIEEMRIEAAIPALAERTDEISKRDRTLTDRYLLKERHSTTSLQLADHGQYRNVLNKSALAQHIRLSPHLHHSDPQRVTQGLVNLAKFESSYSMNIKCPTSSARNIFQVTNDTRRELSTVNAKSAFARQNLLSPQGIQSEIDLAVANFQQNYNYIVERDAAYTARNKRSVFDREYLIHDRNNRGRVVKLDATSAAIAGWMGVGYLMNELESTDKAAKRNKQHVPYLETFTNNQYFLGYTLFGAAPGMVRAPTKKERGSLPIDLPWLKKPDIKPMLSPVDAPQLADTAQPAVSPKLALFKGQAVNICGKTRVVDDALLQQVQTLYKHPEEAMKRNMGNGGFGARTELGRDVAAADAAQAQALSPQ